MRLAALMLVATGMVLSGCKGGSYFVVLHAPSSAERQAVQSSVEALMRDVARDVTQDGPTAWRRHFEDTPAFFMAVNGQMAFGDSEAATEGIKNVAEMFKQIALTWGEVRVDPLATNFAVVAAPYEEKITMADGQHVESSGFFTAVAERRNGQWQFRDVHWSVPAAPPANGAKPPDAKAP